MNEAVVLHGADVAVEQEVVVRGAVDVPARRQRLATRLMVAVLMIECRLDKGDRLEGRGRDHQTRVARGERGIEVRGEREGERVGKEEREGRE